MADNGGSGVNALAIVAIFVLVIGAGFLALKTGLVPGSRVDVKIQPTAPAATTAPAKE